MFIKNIKLVLYFLIMIFLFSGCTHESVQKSCSAGSGGNVNLILRPQHHGVAITGSAQYRDSAFVKFNAVNSPGSNPTNYDIVAVGDSGKDFVNVYSLKCGQYFIMMTGFDTSAAWGVRVIGGLPVDFSDTSGTKTVFVAVSE